jgi:PAS domain S-box-containing protein
MKRDPKDTAPFSDLRGRAEEALNQRSMDGRSPLEMSSEELLGLVHELRVHQFELEMQNEELSRTREELEHSHERYKALYDFAPVGYVTIDRNGMIRSANLTLAAMLGVERGPLIRHPLSRFVPKSDLGRFFHFLEELKQSAGLHRCEVELRRNDGTRFFARLEGLTVEGDSEEDEQSRIAVSDISAQKRAETSRAESEAHYRTIFESAGIGIVRYDIEGRLLAVNPAFAHMLGYARGGLTGRTWQELTHPEHVQQDVQRFDGLIACERDHYSTEKRYLHADGHPVWANVTVTCLRDEDGTPSYLVGMVEDITERKRVEEALRESEARYRILFSEMIAGSALHEVVLNDRGEPVDSRFLDINPAFERLTGRQREQVIGKTLLELWPETERYWIDLVADVARTGEPKREENYFQPLGRYFEVMAFRPAEGQCAVTFTDVTDRREAVEVVRRERDNLIRVFEAMADGVYVADEDYNIQYVNSALTREFGLVEGRKCFEYFQDRQEACPWCKSQDVFAGKTVRWEWRSPRNGRTYELIDTPLASPDGGTWKLEIFRDVTERKRTEEALREAKEAAESASRAKSAFLANMSHEIRTPVSGVLGMIELVLRDPSSPNQLEYLRAGQKSGRSLLRIIDEILDFSSIEAGRLTVEEEEFDPGAMVNDVAGSLATDAQTKGLELVCQVESDVPERVISDEGRVRQVLVNLVGNAIKFTPEGEVVVRMELDGSGGGSSPTRNLFFFVSDTGIGIPREKMDVIFESFRQVDGSVTRSHGGTGLGLAISKRIVEKLGGEIRVASDENEGTTFTFTIPVRMVSSASARREPPRIMLTCARNETLSRTGCAGITTSARSLNVTMDKTSSGVS